MSLSRLLVVATVALAISGACQLFAHSQGESAEGLSLGALARQQKAQREKAGKKPAKEFTNDNLPARPAAAGLTVAAEMSAESQEKTTEEPENTEAATTESAPAHDEKYYRDEMSKLQTRLETHRRQLSVLEQKMSQGDMQYYANPQKTLEQTSTPSFYSDVNKLRDEMAKKKQEIAGDEQAMENLRDQLRREGAPPGWLR